MSNKEVLKSVVKNKNKKDTAAKVDPLLWKQIVEVNEQIEELEELIRLQNESMSEEENKQRDKEEEQKRE